ncbi:MAG: hypothetical protein IBJ09_10825 [Bacteroidia bacterium]|nr:hypothetical protein [Bacteroidia bacterium]
MKSFRDHKKIAGRFLLMAFILVFTSGLVLVFSDGGFSTAKQGKISKTDSIPGTTETFSDKPADDKDQGGDSGGGKMPIALPDFRSAIDFFLSFFRTFRPSAQHTGVVPVSHGEARDTVIRI